MASITQHGIRGCDDLTELATFNKAFTINLWKGYRDLKTRRCDPCRDDMLREQPLASRPVLEQVELLPGRPCRFAPACPELADDRRDGRAAVGILEQAVEHVGVVGCAADRHRRGERAGDAGRIRRRGAGLAGADCAARRCGSRRRGGGSQGAPVRARTSERAGETRCVDAAGSERCARRVVARHVVAAIRTSDLGELRAWPRPS